jgi:hypothetical protein
METTFFYDIVKTVILRFPFNQMFPNISYNNNTIIIIIIIIYWNYPYLLLKIVG